MKYTIITEYNYTETTCGELVNKLEKSGGDINCVESDFIDPLDPCEIEPVNDCWGWIENQRKSKKLYLVEELSSRAMKEVDHG